MGVGGGTAGLGGMGSAAEDGRLSSFLVNIDSYILVDAESDEVKLPSRVSSKENCHLALLQREARGCQGRRCSWGKRVRVP